VGISESDPVALSSRLYDWSITENEAFWRAAWDFLQIKHSVPAAAVRIPPDPHVPFPIPRGRWFPDTRLNFAENLLTEDSERPAIVFWGEDKVRRELSFHELRLAAESAQHALMEVGVSVGDRVAAVIPNMPEAIIGMLGTSARGAIWTSCSPDFGVAGIVDRFGQTAPKVLICADGYFFKGTTIDTLEKCAAVVAGLPSLTHVVIVPYTRDSESVSAALAHMRSETRSSVHFLEWSEFLAPHGAARTNDTRPHFEQLPFDHPLYILYSSGTTGKPKCITHSAGGTLLEHKKELYLHTNLKPVDRIFYQTTCGWMMWNFLVSALSVRATVVLYDGFPLLKDGTVLFELAERERVTVFGTNAKFLALVGKEGIKPRMHFRLNQVHTVLSTGSPLSPESFDYVYRDISPEVCLSSISGGTDIIGCFALGSPLLPVYRGELQTRSLGLAVDVFDENGTPVREQTGELVCTNAFPSMPVGFWGDDPGERYFNAYFARYPGIWHHGDFVELNERGGLVFHGRSDAVLNPGGVRFGTAEIYEQVEQFPEVLESVVIGQDWEQDVRVVLFVRLRPGVALSEELKQRIRNKIRTSLSPFHVPKVIAHVRDIPRTRSGKIVELAVRDIVHGRPVKNLEALANPEALELFKDIPELAQ
jgi:acetoacetyl-CoA synthetase